MKFFIDTEFLEGPQSKRFLGIKYGETKPTIDLISIGIVDESGREFYAISKEFNLCEAWNRWETLTGIPGTFGHRKKYWIRENVLKPVFQDLVMMDKAYHKTMIRRVVTWDGYRDKNHYFTYSNFEKLLNKYGKSNKRISEEILEFVYKVAIVGYPESNNKKLIDGFTDKKVEFYAYYADYDWVAFCWLFGKMKDLPAGFPMYCNDLKQMLDEKVSIFCSNEIRSTSFTSALNRIKKMNDYPKQSNEHSAIYDAKWNYDLYKFIKNLDRNK